ncbi:hypothetical protein [Thiobacillus denitrificans]|uniref:hypothetical protein n=1 Tax=Thiobacillus denitrificans TaxID=36861 RepID=UPI00036681DE|nr:hypothetical protein [Thiobacillus denitrificans]
MQSTTQEAAAPAAVQDTAVSSVQVTHWNSIAYNGDLKPTCDYQMKITDHRGTHGQVYLDVSPVEGHTDDLGIGLCAEINALPGSEDSHVPCIHVYGSDGNVVFSIFQDGLSRLILRPETGIRIVNGVRLPNGEYAYAVEGN